MEHDSLLLAMCKGGKWIMMRNCKNHETRRGGIAVIFLLAVWLFWGSITVLAAEEESALICRQEILEMLRNTDSSWHDISALKLTIPEVNEIWFDLREKEGYVEYNSYGVLLLSYKFSNGYVTHMSLMGMDDEYPLRYASIKNHISIVQQATKDMTDIEKVLYVNEYVDEQAYYYFDADSLKNRVSGPLYKGYGACLGYTETVRLLLRHINVPVTSVASSAMNHAWDMVQIDGEWYHMDATWNDVKGKGGTDTEHIYLVRNDNEFQNNLKTKHYNWVVNNMILESTSTKYTNWFVHDIRGKMHYFNGLWYYIDNKTGDIVRSEVDVNQSAYEVLIDKDTNGISSLSITKVENNVLYYTANGIACEKSLIVESEMQPVGLDWSNADYWREGHYSLNTGEYQFYNGRVCLNDYIELEAGKGYQAQISDGNYRMLIREYDEKKKYIASWNLSNGMRFKTNDSTRYLGVSIYSRNRCPSYEEYVTLFRNGLQVKLVEAEMVNVNETLSWNGEEYWRSGCYMLHTARYSLYNSRICLLDYVSVSGESAYEVNLSNSNYQMLIRELSKDKRYLTSHNLKNGEQICLMQETAYLAISIYNPQAEYINYEKYIELFESGIEIGLTKVKEEENTDTAILWADTTCWRSGHYSMMTGIYQDWYKSRVCLSDYVTIDNTSAYEVILSDGNYHMLIREMNGNKSFIMSHNLAGGDIFIPSEETSYLAVSLYMPDNDANATYSNYLGVIQAGVGLQATDAAASVSVLMLEDVFVEEMTEEISEEETTEVEETTEEETEAMEEINEEEESESTEIETMPVEEEVEEETETSEVEENTEEEKETEVVEETMEEVIQEEIMEESEAEPESIEV